MTDAEKKGQEQQKDEKKGKWWFFDIFNEELRKNNRDKAANDIWLAMNDSLLDKDKKDAQDEIRQGINNVKTLINNRVEMRKARLNNGYINTRVTLLGWREKAAMFKATAKALFKFDAKKGVLERVEEAQNGVARKYRTKRKSLIRQKKEVDKKPESIGKHVKLVLKGEVKSFMVSAERRKVKRKHKNINRALNIDKGILNCLGILTSPAKVATDAIKYTANKLKQGYYYVTDVNNLQEAAKGLGHMAASVQQGATKIGEYVKSKTKPVRVVDGDRARDFKTGATNKLNAGLKFPKNFLQGIKEAPGQTWASLQGFYEATINKARIAYNNLREIGSAVNKGYKEGVAAYAIVAKGQGK